MSLLRLLARDVPIQDLSKKQQGMGCLAYDPAVDPAYSYIPNLSAGIVFTVAFGLMMIAHIAQASVKRKWWYYTFAIGALGKISTRLIF